MAQPDKRTRLQAFFSELRSAPLCADRPSALQLLQAILNSTEDRLTSISYDPTAFGSDGRLYPPMPDAERSVPGRSDLTRYRSRGHNVFIRNNGAIEIRELNDNVELEKPGRDGKGIWVP